MKFVKSFLAATLLLAAVGTSHAAMRIEDDHGGQIGTYITKFERLRSSGQSVVIDGLCASACTLVLSAVPHNKICVTSRARLGFHAAFDFGMHGRMITDPEATMMLYSMYPTPVRRWISARGGLTPQMLFLHGRQLQAMYQPCEGSFGQGIVAQRTVPRGTVRQASVGRRSVNQRSFSRAWASPHHRPDAVRAHFAGT
jgi:hypothetical protein